MARARISLPVPLSPVMRTLTLVRGDALGVGHQLAHVAADDGVARLGGIVVGGPEAEALFAFGARALEVLDASSGAAGRR